ncbi:MAG: hypothetical protein ABIP93_17865 [Gemmatimonadaceae bacterium]
MMMAHDSSQTPPSRLDEETLNAVRLALQAYLHDATEPTSVQSALHMLAAEARTRSVLPEQLLVVLKDVWNALPDVRSMTDSQKQVRLLERVVTMCIKEYYSA